MSRATKDLVGKMQEPLTVQLYLDGDLDANMLRLRRATEDMVRELNMYASEQLLLESVNPNSAITEEEREAEYAVLESRGLRGMSVTVRSRGGKMTEQVIFPPLAVVDRGCGSFLIVSILTCFGWIPGVIGALIILNKND